MGRKYLKEEKGSFLERSLPEQPHEDENKWEDIVGSLVGFFMKSFNKDWKLLKKKKKNSYHLSSVSHKLI